MKKIDITKTQLDIIKKVLNKYPDVIIYGSRIKGSSKKFSDLDICLKNPISAYEYELIVEAFENSDLPFRVDISEYQKVPKDFQKTIDEQGIKLKEL